MTSEERHARAEEILDDLRVFEAFCIAFIGAVSAGMAVGAAWPIIGGPVKTWFGAEAQHARDRVAWLTHWRRLWTRATDGPKE